MQALSSLELMLEKIQQQENEPKDLLPPLPVRPVSKGRLPPRARRLLPNNLLRNGAGNKQNNGNSSFGDVVAVAAAYASKSSEELIQINRLDDTREGKVQGALVLQRCFRGYQARCYYNELKSRVISLQSYIRGENSRKAYQRMVVKMDHIKVPYSFLVNLQRQVLRTEAALRNTEANNAALKIEIKQYEKRWMENESRMNSMEKMWQDQLRIVQINLAAAKKGRGVKPTSERSLEKLFDLPHKTEPELNSKENSISHPVNPHNIVLNDDDGKLYRVKHIIPEFQKLEHKFDAWKREYKIRLNEARATVKTLPHSSTEKSGKTWWRRQTNMGI